MQRMCLVAMLLGALFSLSACARTPNALHGSVSTRLAYEWAAAPGKITQWTVSVGEQVKKGQVIAVYQTAQGTQKLKATHSGQVFDRYVQKNQALKAHEALLSFTPSHSEVLFEIPADKVSDYYVGEELPAQTTHKKSTSIRVKSIASMPVYMPPKKKLAKADHLVYQVVAQLPKSSKNHSWLPGEAVTIHVPTYL